MAGRILKVPALQGAAALADGGSLDFVLPRVGVIDPGKSYISIRADVDVTEVTPATGLGIHAAYLDWRERAPHRNGVLIGDYELRSSTVGVLEACLQSNVPRANLAAFERDADQLRSDAYRTLGTQFDDSVAGAYSQGGFYDGTGIGGPGAGWTVASPFMAATSAATSGAASTAFGTDVRIYLDELSPLCRQVPALDLVALGEVRLRARLDLSQAGNVQEHRPHTSMYGDIPCANIGGAPTLAVVTTEQALSVGAASDFDIVVGDPVLVQYTPAGPGLVVVDQRLVTAVALTGAAPATVQITVDGAQIPANATLVFIQKITGPAAGETTITPVDTDQYVTLNPVGGLVGPVELAAARFRYLGSSVAIVYPIVGGATQWDNVTVTAVSLAVVGGVAYIRLAFGVNLTAVPAGAGAVYVVSSSPTAFNVIDATRTILTFNATNIDRLRLWPGAKVRVTVDNGAAPPAAKAAIEALVASVAQNGANVDVTLTAAVPAGGANFRLRLVSAGALTLRLSQPALVLKTLAAAVGASPYNPAPRELTFESWAVEVASIPQGVTQFQKLFPTPPSCSAMFFMLVARGGAAPSVLSYRNGLASYRIRLNEVPTSAEEIVPFGALHHDAVITTIEASPLSALRSLADGYSTAANRVGGTLDYDAGDVLIMPALLDAARANSVGLVLAFRAATAAELTLYAVRSQLYSLVG